MIIVRRVILNDLVVISPGRHIFVSYIAVVRQMPCTTVSQAHYGIFGSGRNGIYMDGTYGFGPYGNIFGARTQLLFGGKFIYAGISAAGQFHPIDSKFNSPYDNFIMCSAGAVLGATVTLWKFQPYVQLGGGYATPLISGNKSINTFNANAEAGIDIHLSSFAIGVFYKFDYFIDCGATDSFGISLGYRL